MIVEVEGFPGVQALVADAPRAPALWPSMGEHPAYDASSYAAMSADAVRNRAYAEALAPLVPGRRVLDVGTGSHLDWALLAARSGAREVVAVEGMAATADEGRRTLAAAGPEAGRVRLVHAWAADLRLEAPVDVCVSEIIGSIGGAEGAAAVLRDVSARLLAPGGVHVPDRCVTYAAAVALRDLAPAPAFAPDGAAYLAPVFASVGRPFDVRLCFAGADPGVLVTGAAPVETLAFNGDLREQDEEGGAVPVLRPGAVDGLLLWMRLWCAPGAAPVDALHEATNWMTVYLPVLDEPVPVAPGERVEVALARRTSDDGVHPDYEAVLRVGGVEARRASAHHDAPFRGAPVYATLFPEGASATTTPGRPAS